MTRSTSPPILSFDPGPSIRQRSDGTLVSQGAGRVVLEDRLEPGAQTRIRGARRTNVLDDLRAHDVITKRQHDAANRFLDDCSIAGGGGLVANLLATPGASGGRTGLPEAQLAAMGRVRAAWALLGGGTAVFRWVVFDGQRLTMLDAAHRQRKGTASAQLVAALDALDQHYNGRPTGLRGIVSADSGTAVRKETGR